MAQTFSARCNCGAITATITGQPIAVRQCWCRQCQKVAAGGGSTNAIFATADLRLHGELGTWNYVADSGNAMTHSFCAACATPVMAQTSARPHLRTVRLGFLDEPHGLAPHGVIWADEAPAWAVFDPALPITSRQPPPPPQQP